MKKTILGLLSATVALFHPASADVGSASHGPREGYGLPPVASNARAPWQNAQDRQSPAGGSFSIPTTPNLTEWRGSKMVAPEQRTVPSLMTSKDVSTRETLTRIPTPQALVREKPADTKASTGADQSFSKGPHVSHLVTEIGRELAPAVLEIAAKAAAYKLLEPAGAQLVSGVLSRGVPILEFLNPVVLGYGTLKPAFYTPPQQKQ